MIKRDRLPRGLKDLARKLGHVVRHGSREFDGDLELIAKDLAAQPSISLQPAGASPPGPRGQFGSALHARGWLASSPGTTTTPS